MKQITLKNYENIEDFIEKVENADTWDAIPSEDYEEALEKVGLDYDSYDNPEEMWGDFMKAIEALETLYMLYNIRRYAKR